MKGLTPGSQESYELVDGSHFNEVDLERGADHPEDEALLDAEGRSNEDSRSTPSMDSQTSELLFNINQYAHENGDVEEDFTKDPAFGGSKVGGIRRKLCIALILIFVGIWAAGLFGYSLGSHRHYDYAKHSKKPSQANSTTTETAGNSVIPTKTLIPLEEYPIRPTRQEIPTQALGSEIMTDEVFFLDPGSTRPSKADDEGHYILRENGGFVVKKLADKTYSQVLLKSDQFKFEDKEYTIETLTPNYNLTHAIITTNRESIFRHSSKSHHWIVDFETGETERIPADEVYGPFYLARWSPKFNYIAFVQYNNLFVYDIKTKKSTKITKDGGEDILHGRTDWVYEEEVFATDAALWWSPDESNLIFMSTDDSKVHDQDLEFFISGNLFPEVERIDYPKPGGDNPIVSISKYNLKSGETKLIDHSDSTLGDDFVIYNCEWIDNENFVIRETDRTSKILHYRVFNAETDTSKVTYTVDAVKEYNGWIDKFGEIYPMPKNSSAGRETAGFIDIIVVDGYNHLAYFESVDSTDPTPLTSGDWEVTSGVLAFDQEENLIYFTANRESSFENHLYSLDLKTKTLTSMTPLKENGYFAATFSPTAKYSIIVREGPEFPLMYSQTHLGKRALFNFAGEGKTYHKVKIDEDSDGNPVTVDVIEILPRNFKENLTHPLLVNIYGGPGSRKVNYKFSISFEDSISELLDAVILYMDPRGTGGQGWKYRAWSRGHIGYWEPRDITSLTKKWIDSRHYIDENKTAIWGWSYGGFTTLKTLEYDQGNVFKYGMSVAPVTDWSMYDSIYTERFMGLPKDNKEGYDEARINHMDSFKKVERFLIMHGTGDDNVHIQNSFRLFDKFNLAEVFNYDMQIFPDSNHNINFHNANKVIYNKLKTWLVNAFEGRFDNFTN